MPTAALLWEKKTPTLCRAKFLKPLKEPGGGAWAERIESDDKRDVIECALEQNKSRQRSQLLMNKSSGDGEGCWGGKKAKYVACLSSNSKMSQKYKQYSESQYNKNIPS